MDREFHHSDMKRKIAHALAKGAIMVSPTRFLWDMSVNKQTGEVCDYPVSMVHFARPEGKDGERMVVLGSPEKQKPLELEYRVQCAACQRERRRRRMIARALEATTVSFANGCRVWKCTLTCSPDYLYKAKCIAIMNLQERSVVGENFVAGKMSRRAFAELDRVVYRDIQKFLKRLRSETSRGKKDGLKFTFLCVTERTPDTRKDGTPNVNAGQPHYHLLLHEASAASPVRKRELVEGEWPGGFAHFRLVEQGDTTAALYACKYLNKDGGRVRASIRYGLRSQDRNAVDGSPTTIPHKGNETIPQPLA